MFFDHILAGTQRTPSPPSLAAEEGMPGQLCCSLGFYTGAIFSCYQPRRAGPISARCLQETLLRSKLHSLQFHREEPNDWESAARNFCCSLSGLFNTWQGISTL